MKSFLALFYPLVTEAGFKQVYETIRFIWRAKLLEGSILEAEFELFLRKAWNSRWTTIGISAFWLVFSAVFFAAGVFFENPVFISAGGLAITLYVWMAGVAVQTLVATYYRIQKHNRDSVELVPPEFLKWLQLMGLHERPFRRLPMDDGAAARLDTKIHDAYIYLMIVTLSYTFWLGMFPDGKVWVATLVILSGMLLLILLSHLLGSDIKSALRALKFLVLCYLILAIKMALGMGIFPNLADDIRNKFKPQLEKTISSMMMGWITPKSDSGKPPTGDADKPPPTDKLASNTPPPKDPPTPPKGDTGGTDASGGNGNAGGSSSGKKRRNLKPYLDERRAKLRVDFPDLFNNEIEMPASSATEQGSPATITPAATPTTPDTLTPFGLPPVKQLP